MRNIRPKLAALIMALLAIGPILWPGHDKIFASLVALAAALGFSATRQSNTGSDAPGGPLEKGLQTSSAPLAIDSTNAARIIR